MTAGDVQSLADRLADAERSCVAIDPLTAERPDLCVDDAYAIQLANVRRRVAQGRVVRGHKIGLTARSMQELFGIDEPDYGHLLDDMFVPEGAPLAIRELIAPRAEIEVAVVLARALRGPGVTVADVIGAADYLVPAIEVIDSRIRDWRIGLADTIADNGSSARVVLGTQRRRVRPTDAVALRRMHTQLHVNGKGVASGTTGAVLGNPLAAVAWLANAIGRRGVALEEGHVVLPGTPLPAVPVSAGTRVAGVFRGLGRVEVSFA